MLSRNRYVSWFAQFRKELSLVESVHPAEMKLCPGFHRFSQIFRIQADNCCCAAVRILVPRRGQFSKFRKDQPLEPCALWCTKLHKLCKSISSRCTIPRSVLAQCGAARQGFRSSLFEVQTDFFKGNHSKYKGNIFWLGQPLHAKFWLRFSWGSLGDVMLGLL